MFQRLRKRPVLSALLVTAAAVVVTLLGMWLQELRPSTKRGGQEPVEPFRIADNFYYVGANDVAAFLITGPEGHVLLDAGYPTTAAMIMKSVATLGFDIKDVKVLINSEPHSDHAGGFALIQQASGARLWASGPSADSIASGGDDPDIGWPVRDLIRVGLLSYPPARVDHRIKDGDTIRVGPIVLTAHITAGHTRGCTSWSFPVHDGDRVLTAVSVCGPNVLGMLRYDGQEADRANSLRRLRSLPADIWVTNHARTWGRYRKFAASRTAARPTDAFIDREGYRTYLDAAEEELRAGRVH